MTSAEQWLLEGTLYDWRSASQRQRWAYYSRMGLKATEQSVFYDQLIQWHASCARADAAEFERMFYFF